MRRKTQALVVLRHGAGPLPQGLAQATTGCGPLLPPAQRRRERLVPRARGVRRRRRRGQLQQHPLRRRPSRRTPTRTGWTLELEDGLSEEDATAESVAARSSTSCVARRRGRGAVHPPAGAARGLRRARASPTRELDAGRAAGRRTCARAGRGAPRQHQVALTSRALRGRVHVIAVSSAAAASTTGRFEFTPRSPTAAGSGHLALPTFADVITEKTSGERSEPHFHPPGGRARYRRRSRSALSGCCGAATRPAPAAAATAAALSGTLNGGGSSAQESAQSAWRAGFQSANGDGVTVNYDPVGSGTGRENFISGPTSFAGSDSALSDRRGRARQGQGALRRQTPIEVPAYVSPIAVVYNLAGRRQAAALRPRRSPRSSPARSPSGTTRRSPRTTRTPSCRAPRSPPCTARTTRAPPRTSPTT